MSAHTQGPWEVVEHSWSSTGIYADGKRIADLDIYEDASEENEEALAAEMLANARLIAVSPELFEALRRLEVAANNYRLLLSQSPGELALALQTLADEAEHARSIYAKATGEAA